jgi:hypothetical protein
MESLHQGTEIRTLHAGGFELDVTPTAGLNGEQVDGHVDRKGKKAVIAGEDHDAQIMSAFVCGQMSREPAADPDNNVSVLQGSLGSAPLLDESA